MKRLPVLVLAVLLAVALASCGDDGPGSGSSPSSSPSVAETPSLTGTSWTLTMFVPGEGDDPVTVPDGVTATAAFDEERVSGSGGCNSFGGPYEVSGDSIELGPIASTLIGCDDERADVEAAYLRALEDARRFAVVGDVLTLRAKGGTVLLTFDRDRDEE